TNWRAGVPRWSPPPSGWTSWLAKLTLSDSGLNCTLTTLPPDSSPLKSRLSSCNSARASFTAGSATGPCLRRLHDHRFVGELQFLDGDHAVPGVERRRLELGREAATQDE